MNEPLDGPSRCAVLLYALGMSSASSILNRLEAQDVKRIAAAAQRLQEVEQPAVERVLQNFQESMSGRRLLPGESATFIQSAIEESGIDSSEGETSDLGLVPEVNGENLGHLLKREHPQTTALVLANIDPERASVVLAQFDAEVRTEVIRRMAGMSTVSQTVLRRIETSLKTELRRLSSGPARKVDGIELAAGILKRLGKADTNQILEGLLREDGQLGDAIKQRMFTFEELGNMDDRGIRNLLKEIDSQVLAKALKIADEAVRNKIFKNMSERAATMLSEDIETLPPMRLSEVEEAQATIVNLATNLIQDGKAVVIGAGGGEQIV